MGCKIPSYFFIIACVIIYGQPQQEAEFKPRLKAIGESEDKNMLLTYSIDLPASVLQNDWIMKGALHCGRFRWLSNSTSTLPQSEIDKLSYFELAYLPFTCVDLPTDIHHSLPKNIELVLPLQTTGLYLVDMKWVLMNGALETRTSDVAFYACYNFAQIEDVNYVESGTYDYSIEVGEHFDWMEYAMDATKQINTLIAKEGEKEDSSDSDTDSDDTAVVTSSEILGMFKTLLMKDGVSNSDYMAYSYQVMKHRNNLQCNTALRCILSLTT